MVVIIIAVSIPLLSNMIFERHMQAVFFRKDQKIDGQLAINTVGNLNQKYGTKIKDHLSCYNIK